MIKASDVQLACADRKTFREHVIALSCSRDFDVDLELAFEEVLDPSDRRILLAVCTSAQVINEAEYFAQHSALADDDTQAEEARAQIQHAHDNRDRVVDNIINHLRGDSESFAQPHTDDATYAASKASLAVDHAISTVCSVAAIRELCRGLSDAKG